MSYQEKQKSAEFLNFLFGGDIKVSDLNNDNDYFANKALLLNDKLEEFIQYRVIAGNDISKGDLMASLNLIEYNPKLIWVKIHHLQYPQVLKIITSYIYEKISYPLYKKEMIKWHNAKSPLSSNLKHLTKSLLKAEILILEILTKRKKRENKNNNVDTQ